MEPEDNNVSTMGAQKEQEQQEANQNGGLVQKASNARNAANNVKNTANNVKKAAGNSKIKAIRSIVSKLPAIATVAIIILIIVLIIGFIGFFLSLPGTFIESIKEFGTNLWGSIVNFFNGDGVTARVTEEDQIALAQKIEDMGYDVVGYGFADAQYEYDNDTATAEDIDGVTNNKIIGISKLDSSRNYLQAYIAQSEAMYVLSSWNVLGAFESFVNNGSNILEFIFGNTDNIDPTTAQMYSEGMLNIVGFEELGGYAPQIRVDRERKLLRIQTHRFGLTNDISIGYGDVLYFDLADWTSIYGKPLELFLSLHLATMMPDLTYDLATSPAFNTKVNIELQEVTSTFKVIYRKSDGTEISQTDIQKIYLKTVCNMTDEQINRFESAGELDRAFVQIMQGISSSVPEEWINATEGSTITNGRIEDYGSSNLRTGFNLSQVEESLLGQKYSQVNVQIQTYITIYDPITALPTGSVPGPTREGTIDKYLPVVNMSNAQEVATVQATLDGTVLSGLTVEQLEELKDLIRDGTEEGKTYLPRIESVVRHWYFNDITYEYGLAGRAKKKVQYATEDEEDPLSETNLNGGSIILDTTYTNANGVFYQLTEPEATGPNPAIVALFKGGSGSTYGGATYNFSGQYYRFDGTRATAQRIVNAKADEEGRATYWFQGIEYATQSRENGDMAINKQQVTFVTVDEYGNENKQDAITAFGILENVHSVEAETVYRMLKELVVQLGYFTNEDFMKPLTQVLLWPVERVGSDTEAGDDNAENATAGIVRKPNQYGIFLQNGTAVNSGDTIIAPGDATVVSVDGNTVRLKFKTISDGNAQALKDKFGTDYFDVERDIVLDMEMTISGISPSVSAGQEVTAGSQIGTATSEDVHILLYNMDKTIVDDIETYMYPTYEGTRLGIFETLTEGEGGEE